jgi:hypothetical protein
MQNQDSPSKYEQLTQYFSTLGSYLDVSSWLMPDFSDVVGQGIADGTAEFNDQLARDFEAAVERHNQEQLRQQQVIAREKQRAERQAIVDAAKRRLQGLPPAPADSQLQLIPAGVTATVREQFAQAQQALDALGADLDSANFDELQRQADAVIGAAERAVAAVPEAIAAELERRRQRVLQLTAKAASGLQDAPPGWDTMNPEPPVAKKVREALKEKDQRLEALQVLIAAGPPEEFDAAWVKADEAVTDVPVRVARVQALMVQRAKESRKAERERLVASAVWRPVAPLGPKDLLILSGDGVVAALEHERLAYDKAFGVLEASKGGENGPFEEALRQALRALETVDRAHEDAVRAREVERKRRTALRDALRQELDALAGTAAGPLPIPGTPEAKKFETVRLACSQALSTLWQALDAAPAEFDKLAQRMRVQWDEASAVRVKAAQDTQLRLDEIVVCKGRLTTLVGPARAKLPAGPSGAIVAAVTGAFDLLVSHCESRIDGRKREADVVVVDEFEALLPHVTSLCQCLDSIVPAKLLLVAANTTIDDDVHMLLGTLAKQGLCESALIHARALKDHVGRIATLYQQIAELLVAYPAIKSNAEYLTAWNHEIDPFIAFEADKDKLDPGQLATGVAKFDGIFDILEERMRARARANVINAAYAASAEGQFIAFWDLNGRAQAIVELTRLVNTGVATCGAIKRCYLASDDSLAAQEFSVEISVDIDGRRGVVVHAHCQADGTPKPGNACHFKLANNKREGGNTCMLNATLRGELLLPAATILNAAPGCWEGPRPDYMRL